MGEASVATVFTDASGSHGWGATTGDRFIQGKWSEPERREGINWRELRVLGCILARRGKVPKDKLVLVRMDNATPSRREKSVVSASCRKSLLFEDTSANMRKLFGSRGSGNRQGALFTGEEGESRASDEDLDVLAAYGKRKKSRGGKEEEGGPS